MMFLIHQNETLSTNRWLPSNISNKIKDHHKNQYLISRIISPPKRLILFHIKCLESSIHITTFVFHTPHIYIIVTIVTRPDDDGYINAFTVHVVEKSGRIFQYFDTYIIYTGKTYSAKLMRLQKTFVISTISSPRFQNLIVMVTKFHVYICCN